MINFCFKSFKNKQKQLEHSFTYFMLDKILNEQYSIKDRSIEFVDSKPFLKNRELQFSLSHSGNYIVLAFSKNNCGVDIEKIKNRNFKSISERMNFKCVTLKDFYIEWTKYEAEYKLGEKPQKVKSLNLDDYILTSVSNNIDEEFQFFIQIEREFSKLTV